MFHVERPLDHPPPLLARRARCRTSCGARCRAWCSSGLRTTAVRPDAGVWAAGRATSRCSLAAGFGALGRPWGRIGSSLGEVVRRGRALAATGPVPRRTALGGAPLAPRRGPSTRPPDARRAGLGWCSPWSSGGVPGAGCLGRQGRSVPRGTGGPGSWVVLSRFRGLDVRHRARHRAPGLPALSGEAPPEAPAPGRRAVRPGRTEGRLRSAAPEKPDRRGGPKRSPGRARDRPRPGAARSAHPGPRFEGAPPEVPARPPRPTRARAARGPAA